MKLYEVTAKCGHVGRGLYYAGKLYVRAEDRVEAEAKARVIPRVKHTQKHAILAMCEIGCDEYKAGLAANRANPYFKCRSDFELSLCFRAIVGDIHPEEWVTRSVLRKPPKKSAGSRRFFNRNSKYTVLLRMWRKAEKYGHDYIIEMEAA